MNTDVTGIYTCKECHQTESLWNHITTDHKEEEQLEDRRNVGESGCNSGDGTDQRVQSLMVIMMTIFCAPVFPLIHWSFSLSSFVIPIKCFRNCWNDTSQENLTVTNSRDWFGLLFGDITYEKRVCTLKCFDSRVTTRYILVTAMFPIARQHNLFGTKSRQEINPLNAELTL